MHTISYAIFSKHPQFVGCTFSSLGGVSLPPYASLNVSDAVGDSPLRVKKNKELILKVLGVDRLVELEQMHSSKIVVVDEKDPLGSNKGDALITNRQDTALMIKHADCQALILFDPVKNVFGALHAGFRGLCQEIVPLVVEALTTNFGTDPKDLIVSGAPSLGLSSAYFTNYKSEFPRKLWRYKDALDRIDLPKIALHQLKEAGVQETKIEQSPIDTFCDKRFFSYRRERVTGRNGTFALLRSKEL